MSGIRDRDENEEWIVTNTDSCDCVRVDDFEAMSAHGIGAFYWLDDFKSMGMILPSGDFCRLNFDPSRAGPCWRHTNGDYDKPSVEASIRQFATHSDGRTVDLWHGFMTNGRFISC